VIPWSRLYSCHSLVYAFRSSLPLWALLREADQVGRPDAGGQCFLLRAELTLIHHSLLQRHRRLAGGDATAERLRTAAAGNPSIKACTAADHNSA